MSNPQLNRLLRGGGLTSFHVGASSVGRDVAREASVFNGERFAFSADVKDNHNFEKKENREESGGEKRTKGDSDSESDDDGPHFNSDGIHAKSSDADGDGKKNEKKKKKKPDQSDKNKNEKPDGFEKK